MSNNESCPADTYRAGLKRPELLTIQCPHCSIWFDSVRMIGDLIKCGRCDKSFCVDISYASKDRPAAFVPPGAARNNKTSFELKDGKCSHCGVRNTVPAALEELEQVRCSACRQWFTFKTDNGAMTVPEILVAAAKTQEQRNKLYGNSYKRFGTVMKALLPDGIELNTEDEWNRFGVFFHAVGKITRYAANLKTGGHKDSAHDLVVYGAMLEELTEEETK